MKPWTIAELRSNRTAMAAAAGVALFLLLVGVATLRSKPVISRAPPTPMSTASPGGAVTGTAPDLGLAPGETVVVPADKPAGPLMPHYAAPPAPPPAPASAEPESTSAPPQAAAAAAPKAKMPVRPQPRTPDFARGDAHPTSPFDTWPNPPASRCDQCGEVVVVTVWPDMAEVRVRFEDGNVRTLRSPVPTRWHVGDHVRLERGRLVRD